MAGYPESRREGCNHRPQSNGGGSLVCDRRPQSLHRRSQEGILRGRRSGPRGSGVHRLRRAGEAHRPRRPARRGAGRQPAELLPLPDTGAGGQRLGPEAGARGRAVPGLLPGPGPLPEAEGGGHLPQPDPGAAGNHREHLVRQAVRLQPGHPGDALREVRGDCPGARLGGLPLRQDGGPVYQLPHEHQGRGLGPFPRRQRDAGVAEQDDAQGQTGRHHPGCDGAPGGRRAHLRPLGTVHGPQRQGQGRPPGTGGLDGYAEPGHPGRRDLREGQRRHPERIPGKSALHGGRPEAAAH